MLVVIKKAYADRSVGDTIDVVECVAKSLIEDGFAELPSDKKEVKKQTKEKTK